MVRAFGMNPKVVGVRVPFRSRHFLSQKLWHFHKNTRSCVENECCWPRTVNVSNVIFTSKIPILQVEKLAQACNLHWRVGCFCNMGACQVHLGLSDEQIWSNYKVSEHSESLLTALWIFYILPGLLSFFFHGLIWDCGISSALAMNIL